MALFSVCYLALLGTTVTAFSPAPQRQQVPTEGLQNAIANFLDFSVFGAPTARPTATNDERIVKSYIDAINARVPPSTIALQYFDDDVAFVDTSYYNPIEGREALEKHMILHCGSSALSTFAEGTLQVIAIDDIVSSTIGDTSKVCVMYHLSLPGGEDVKDTTAISFYNLRGGKITQVFDVTEPSSPKPGDSGLKLLVSVFSLRLCANSSSALTRNIEIIQKLVSKLIGDESIVVGDGSISVVDSDLSVVERYFESWNRRDMTEAVSLFTNDCNMRDLQYDSEFTGRAEFERHLLRVKDCLPGSFDFVVDDVALSPTKAGVVWHVENDGSPLAFTRGCSFYTIDEGSGLIESGFEIPEKAPPKMGWLNSAKAKFVAEPVRFIPIVIWVAYMFELFIADGPLPGVNALALEQRTWEEVRDLSLNFFLVSPILQLPFAPTVHPCLEGVFNLLLSWAALFAGFLSDDRKDKPNLLPFGPMLVGMQFLTSGFLLPYLILRTPETSVEVYREDIDGELQAKVAEWRPLGPLLGSVGALSIWWFFFGRPEFGELSDRYASFMDLLRIDRVGSSFLVDLVIFATFQCWFVDDDLQRRGIGKDELPLLRNTAKYVPFFGLASYLTARPALASRADE